jgi:hypothetical protein
MASDPHTLPDSHPPTDEASVEMPRPTVAPMVLSLGMVLLASGVVLGVAFLIVGAVVLAIGLSMWVGQLLPGRGHEHEALVEPARRAQPVTGVAGTVCQMREGLPGYRMRLPLEVHPLSAGIRGGLFGGLVMPFPALLWGLFSGHGIWFPVNLLAGIVLPGIDNMADADLERFQPVLLMVALCIHAIISVVFGLLYGVLLPTLPPIPRPIAWGGALMPLLWSAVSFSMMGVVNPLLQHRVDWPWFIFSQFLFGLVAALVVIRAGGLPGVAAGLLGGLVGGVLMPIPALLWGLLSGRGIWYPLNLLTGMLTPGLDNLPAEVLQQYHPEWLGQAILVHAAMSLGFGLAYGLLLSKLPEVPGPLVWGGVLMPLLWTATSFGLMGVLNKALQDKVSWPWFVVSQFVFGLAAAIVVVRSETVPIPPAGRGPSAGQPRQGGQL